MGSLFAKPKMPAPNPELKAQREAEEQRIAEEKESQKRFEADQDRIRTANLIGQRSTQSEDIEGFSGFRRRQMGKSGAGSIRS